ncbi:MAG: hypothetical protein ACRDRS_03280 [Pseudonocardiaceae bacterium]
MVDELNRRAIPVIRFDLGEVVVAAELVGSRWVGQLRIGNRCARLEDVSGIYYRRPSAPSAPPGTDPQIGAWIEAEARWGLRGLLVALPRKLWVNWPPAVHAAEHKPWQLVEAAAAGLRVPRTAITNDPDSAASFASDAAPVLYKAFRAEPVCIGGKTHLVYATPVDARQCRSETIRLGLRFAACDFSVDHSGVWWHLEVNPAGQWAWDHPRRDAIASAIADALTGETTPP